MAPGRRLEGFQADRLMRTKLGLVNAEAWRPVCSLGVDCLTRGRIAGNLADQRRSLACRVKILAYPAAIEKRGAAWRRWIRTGFFGI
jgi:hypothetical protein